MKVVIVLGYGVFTKDNLQYKSYLDDALTILERTKPDFIIATGAMTNKNHPELAEAQSQADYLIRKKPELKNKILLESHSLSTPQNIEFSERLLREKQILPDSIKIICDSIRAPKVFYLAATILNSLLNLGITEEEIYLNLFHSIIENKMDVTQGAHYSYKNISIEGINLHRSMEEVGTQITSSMIEVGFSKYPQLEKEFLAWRKKQFEIS